MLVIDASVAVEAVLDRTGVRDRIADVHLFAPTLIDIEVVSTLRRLTINKELSVAEARAKLLAWQQLEIDRVDAFPFLDVIWQLRENLTVYDAAYVAVAMRLGAPLITRDMRMAAVAGRHCQIIAVES